MSLIRAGPGRSQLEEKMFKRLLFTSSFRLAAFAIVALVSAAPARADDSGWVLTQRSANFGDQYVYVSPQGLKLVSPKQQVNIVTCAPSWNVCFYNDRTHSFYATTFQQWMAELDHKLAGRGSDMSERKWNKSSDSNIAGVKATEYVMNGGYLTPSTKKSSIRHANCWISEQITIPPQVSQMLAKVYGLPDTRTFPLKVSYVNTSGALNNMLDTYRAQACPIPTSYFGVPSNYKRCASEAEVMMDDETKQIFNDMMSDGPSSGSGATSRTYNSYPNNAPTYAGNNPPSAANPVGSSSSGAAAAPTPQPGAASASGETVNIGGLNVDKEKLRKVIEALKNANKSPTQAQPQTPQQPQ